VCNRFGYSQTNYNGWEDQIIGPATAVYGQAVTYATAAYVQQSGCTPHWQITGGVINGSSTSHNISVTWSSNATTGTLQFSTTNCQGVQIACCYVLEVVIESPPPPPPVTISGYVTNNCGTGVEGVTIKFTGTGNSVGQNPSTVTDYAGYYSVTVPYGYSSTISASKPNHQFSASQNYTNTTANRTLNFSVVGQQGLTPSATRGSQDYITFGGLVVGYVYLLAYYDTNGAFLRYEDFYPWASSQVYMTDYKICIKLKCSSGAYNCSN